jgi:hypothetical protein
MYEWCNSRRKIKRKPKCAHKNKKESKKLHWTTNEDKLQKISCSKKILETTWKKLFVLRSFCVNDNVKVDLENIQMMCCIFCYQNLVIKINLRTQVRKALISYYKKKWNNFSKKNMWM